MERRKSARGFTLIELVAVIAGIVGLLFLLLVVEGGIGHHHCGARQMKDATQVRGIQQAMAIWANQNNGLYPLPSQVDLKNATVGERGTAKDHTANILSLLVYTGGASVELLISPAESNTGPILQMVGYQFDNPKGALDPANALWDPALKADFTGGKVGNTSYAHVLPGGGREKLWQDTFTTNQPIVGNRGPEIASGARDKNGVLIRKYVNPDSNTFLIHGSRSSWEGNIAWNDGHVNFETRIDPDQTTYRDAWGKTWRDCLFYDEPDDAASVNAWMSIWVTGGDAKKDFTGIWD